MAGQRDGAIAGDVLLVLPGLRDGDNDCPPPDGWDLRGVPGHVEEAQQGILGERTQMQQVLRTYAVHPGCFLGLHPPQLIQHLLTGEGLTGVAPLTVARTGARSGSLQSSAFTVRSRFR